MTAELRLSPDQIEAALYAVGDFVARRRLANRPLPKEVLALHQTLSIAAACGSESGTEEALLSHDDDLINTDEAATLLNCSPRWVRTIRSDLDGRKLAGRWRYPRQHVIEYAAAARKPRDVA